MGTEDALRAAGIEITPAGSDGDLWHDAAVPGHIREAATPGEYLDKPRPGILLADCSCGAEYEVPQGGDEYGALEKAHREHVAAASAPRKGQIIKFRRSGRTQYMRLILDASETTADMSRGFTLHGYRTRADGSPTHVRPVTRNLGHAEVEIIVTPADEARAALHCGASRDLLSPAARTEYDRLLALVRGETRP